MQKRRRTRIRRRRFLADDLRIDRLYVSCLGEIMKEIIVREGFLPRQPWQAKRRTIGRVPGQQGTNSSLCNVPREDESHGDPLRGFLQKERDARTCVTSGVFDAVWQHLGTEIRENKIFYSLIIVVKNDENFLIMMDKVWQTASTLFNRVWKRNLAKKFERIFSTMTNKRGKIRNENSSLVSTLWDTKIWKV